jgi:hypothetical protein
MPKHEKGSIKDLAKNMKVIKVTIMNRWKGFKNSNFFVKCVKNNVGMKIVLKYFYNWLIKSNIVYQKIIKDKW